MLVPEQARLVRVPFVLRVACVVKRWFPKRHRDTRFPTSTIIQLWHFQPPLFFFPLSPSLSLSPSFARSLSARRLKNRGQSGREWNFRSQFFFYGSFYGRQSILQGGREGWITQKTSGACITPISQRRFAWEVIDATSITANRIILSNEICEIDVYYVFIRFAPVRFFVRRREMEFTFRTSSIFSSASKNK